MILYLKNRKEDNIMKIRKKALMFLVATSMALTSTGLFATTTQNTTYSYEIDSDAWNSSTSKKERVDMCQIPEDILDTLSTEALIDTVLDYPFFNDIYFFNSLQDGFENLKAQFNGLNELLNREDVGQKLLNKYESVDAEMDENLFLLSNIEILLAQPEVQNTLDNNELDLLTYEVEEKYMDKCDNKDYFGKTAETFYAISAEQQDSERSPYYTTTTVKTPNGSSVKVLKRGEELSSSEKSELDNYIASSYPNVVKQRSATTNYNCHSYAWYSTSSSNQYWMNDPSAYWKDGSYSSVSLSNVGAGDKVFYTYGDHSARVYSRVTGPISSDYKGLKFISKWGQCGLYIHTPTDAPYDSSSLKFYR